MKVLFFHAAAQRPQIVLPLMGQAENTLRPFHRFLGQAIHTAKQRQTRYQLTWEKVRDLRTIRLEPLDSLLLVPRRQPGVVLKDWPAVQTYNLSQQGFVVNRGAPFRVETATPTTFGLRVQTDVPLLPTDRVIWCGEESGVQQEAISPPPSKVKDVHGKPLKLIGKPRVENENHWLLVVEGKHEDHALLVDDEEVEAQALSSMEELRRVEDSHGRKLDVKGGMLRVEELPADGPLRGDNGVRYRWQEQGGAGRSGCWIQLLQPESSDTEEFLDPRAAFCEGDVEAVWTQPRHSKDTTFKVKKVDQDRYQLLLDRYPPERSTLYLPVNVGNLHLQKRALRQLADAPLPHHRGLLRLCEDPGKARWPEVKPIQIHDDGWRSLTDASRSGTEEQRDFVRKALGTDDFAFLEGPPGSGKTTAICEIVQQLVAQGQRVLLCASTHVAIDNVLERLVQSAPSIFAVRIGKLDKVDDKVQATQLDQRVKEVMNAWRGQPALNKCGDAELEDMAERTVIMAANLTCGTTMGIVNHPLFHGRGQELHMSARPISTMPHWDVLIVDEASKTLIQEFMVPALMAKRWIIVGDVRQLPPFSDRADIVANLRDLVDEHDKPVFPPDHQRACLLLFRLRRKQLNQPGLRWLIVERPGVLLSLKRKLDAAPVHNLSVVRIVAKGSGSNDPVDIVTVDQLQTGRPEVLRLAAADWVLIEDELLAKVSHLLPSNLLLAENCTSKNGGKLKEGDALLLRQGWWLNQIAKLTEILKERGEVLNTAGKLQSHEQEWLAKHDWAAETAWRLTRLHELRRGGNKRDRERLRDELNRLQPAVENIQKPIAEIEDIGLPSILEVVQEGIGEERSNRVSALTAGLKATRPDVFSARFNSLSYQHRMHPEIASFSRDIIYEGQALKDANTIEIRDRKLCWDFGPFRSRRVWVNLDGRETGGVNPDEVQAMAGLLQQFIAWAKQKGTRPKVWEVACLCFYVKQERAISEMLQQLTGDDRKTRFQVSDAPVEIVCGTVDRYQGREADLVLLSMRNTRRVGFLDSPNRLNVGVTRARQQLMIFGKHDYFSRCGISELEELARRSARIEEKAVRRWKGNNR